METLGNCRPPRLPDNVLACQEEAKEADRRLRKAKAAVWLAVTSLCFILFAKKLYSRVNNRVGTGFPDTGKSSTTSIHFSLLRWGSEWSGAIIDSEIVTCFDMPSRFVYVFVSLSRNGHHCLLSLAPKNDRHFWETQNSKVALGQ